MAVGNSRIDASKAPEPAPPRWRGTGRAVVTAAAALALLGVVLAVMQAYSVSAELVSQSQQQAHQVAVIIEHLYAQQIAFALRGVMSARQVSDLEESWSAGYLPPWLDGIYIYAQGRASPIFVHPEAEQEQERLIVEEFSTALPYGLARGVDAQPTLVFPGRPGARVALGCLASPVGGPEEFIVVGVVRLDRLRSELVAPLLALYESLELRAAPGADDEDEWSHPLPAAMRGWSIGLRPAYVREQRLRIFGQMYGYISLTLLALTTLIVAMWFVARVHRREMALAQMKSAFVAGVSHDLKTPLALIRMFAETLQSGRVPTEDKRREYCDVIMRESTRLTHLIDNILDFARIDAQRKEYHLAPTDVAVTVRETYETYRAELDAKGFEHRLTIDDGLPRVNADRDAITQVMMNLISNAVKYSPDEKYLHIELTQETRRGGPGVLISVHDHGIGIRPEDRVRLFESFFRANDGRVQNERGTGLGLSLVKHIVDAHRGAVDVEARLVKGTTFRIFLPGADARMAKSE